jgi:mono/diheme cytochrome c family protein
MSAIAIVRFVALGGFALVLEAGCIGKIGDEAGPFPTGNGGSPAIPGTGGVGGSGGSSGAVASGASGLPCDVASLLSGKCATCHGATPLPGVPMSLVTYADLTGPAKSDPSVTNAAMAVTRMMSTTTPMPPVGSPAATPTEIAALQSWIAAGYPMTGCGTVAPDPFSVPPTCTSNVTWPGGDGALMDPGRACISCHATSGGEAPTFTIAGTLYPTAHEPDLCYGANGTNGAVVVITGADGASFSIVPNAAGNFTHQGAVAKPFQAKVTYMGRERVMATAQTSGDCNSCHTQAGAMSAPGRIILP